MSLLKSKVELKSLTFYETAREIRSNPVEYTYDNCMWTRGERILTWAVGYVLLSRDSEHVKRCRRYQEFLTR